MKFLEKSSKKYFKNKENFMFLEVNEDIRQALEKGTKDVDERDTIREGRQFAFSQLPEFSDKLLASAEKSEYVEEGSNKAEKIQKETRDKIEKVLLDGKSESTSKNLSKNYESLVGEILKEESLSYATLTDIDFALSTLNTFQGNLERRLTQIESHKKEIVTAKQGYLLGFRKEVDVTGEKTIFGNIKRSEKEIFHSRTSPIMEVFEELQNKLKDRQTEIDALNKDKANQAKLHLHELSLEESAEFLKSAKEEIKNPKNSKLSNNLVTKLFPGVTNVSERIEIYREMGIDQGTQDAQLKQLSQNGKEETERVLSLQKSFNKKTDEIDLVKLEKSFKLSPAIEIPETEDLEAIITELEPYIFQNNENNIKAIFSEFEENSNMRTEQRFGAYIDFLQKDGGKKTRNSLPDNLKIKILGYIKYGANQHDSADENDHFSEKFTKFESDKLSPQIKTTQNLFGKLAKIKTLEDVKENYFNEIDGLKSKILILTNDFEQEKSYFSESEKRKVELYLQSLKAVSEKAENLAKEWKEKQKALHERQREKKVLESQLKTYEDNEIKDVDFNEEGKHSKAVNKAQISQQQKNLQKSQEFKEKISQLEFLGTEDEDVPCETILLSDLTILEIDAGNIERNKKKEKYDKNAKFKDFLKNLASQKDAEFLEKSSQERQHKTLELLKEKHVGSEIKISYRKSKYGVSESLKNVSSNKDITGTVLLQTDSGTVLFSGANNNKKIIIIQKSKEGKTEIISLPVPDNFDASKSVSEGFTLGENTSFIGAPTSIIPA